MKKVLFALILILVFIPLLSQNPGIHKMKMPNIDGYKTLICDFHSHTVYSDGSVMPNIRVWEALREGIHVVAVTEHIEKYCRKIPEMSQVDLNTSYNLHLETAKGTDLIVIRGGEISRDMPPGHLNALFLKDVNPLDTKEYTKENVWKAIEEAISQDAFIIWNHPGWKYQQPDTTLWFDFHTEMLEKGWLHGIEIVNWTDGYCVEALGWFGEKNLSPIAGSDTHGPTCYEFDLINSHRPVTLVFVKEHSEQGVKEALFDRRSVAYDGNFLYGDKHWLDEMFKASVTYELGRESRTDVIRFQNTSDVDYEMVLLDSAMEKNLPSKFIIKAQSETTIDVELPKSKNIVAKYKCQNLLYDRDRYYEVDLLL